MEIYEPHKQISMWRDTSSSITASPAEASTSVPIEEGNENKFEYEYASHQVMERSIIGEDAIRLSQKMKRRLVQNREAAKRSRLRKKAYVQQLETSRLKVVQLEQELHQVKQKIQATRAVPSSHSNVGFAGNMITEVAAFEMEYGLWVEEQNRRSIELRDALQANISEVELRSLIDGGLKHYYKLIRIKVHAAKEDIFYLMSGTWRSPVEQFFLWIGGFRPSDLLKIFISQLGPLTNEQGEEIDKLQDSSRQAEDALSRGVDKLQNSLSEAMLTGGLGMEIYGLQMASALEMLSAIEGFVNQADYLRGLALRLMSQILTPHQAARGLLALGEYFERLRALSSLWAARPHPRDSLQI